MSHDTGSRAGSSTGLDPYTICTKTKIFSSLDGLRAFAIAIVIWHHTSLNASQFFSRGIGVTLFFAISGFLITTLLLREREKTGTISLRNFFIRRSLRILPLYYAVLLLYVVLVKLKEQGTAPGEQFFSNLPFFLTFTSNLFVGIEVHERVIFYFSWSLAAQQQFYFLWPTLVRFTRTWHIPVAVVSLLLIASAAGRWGLASGHFTQLFQALASFEPICMGCLVAYIVYRPACFRIAYRIAGQRWSALLAFGLLLLPLVFERTPMAVTSFSLLLLLTVCIIRPDHLLVPILESRIPRYIGMVSYGIYLMHMLSVNTARKLVPNGNIAVVFMLALMLSILAGSASYHLFEKRVLELKKVLIKNRPSLRRSSAN